MRAAGLGWHLIEEIDLVAMVSDHADLARLCSDLEACADGLPTRPHATETRRLRGVLERQPLSHHVRQQTLSEKLFAATRRNPGLSAALAHIRCRGIAQVGQAQDLAAALRPDSISPTAETLGYMLRGFFDGCRADMAFEELAILQFAGERLTASARAFLSWSFAARCAV
jgi:hypothetical protein